MAVQRRRSHAPAPFLTGHAGSTKASNASHGTALFIAARKTSRDACLPDIEKGAPFRDRQGCLDRWLIYA
ncbi:hypothetical protein DVJ77_00155 [Dyella tabacisoli]|uniref:Uncharacterized protein n=1 Tax=Dyella tabacisoli TaxID=2282381 RepID=A0A369UR05_9GAMM|nr:hypothetical protein DVJ77_00155 [Dyella tabacisoli]